MVVIIDNSVIFREAEKIYERFQTAYNLVKRYEASGEPINDATKNIIKTFCYDAFKIYPVIRQQLPILNNLYKIREKPSVFNSQLIELVEKGFLELNKEDISPFDPVTKKLAFDNLFKDLKLELGYN